MSAHAKLFQASGMSAWAKCSQKPWMELDLPDSSSAAAEEGTAAHELAAAVLSTEEFEAADFIGQEFNGYHVSMEMANYVDQYVTLVREMAEGNTIMVEQRVNFQHLAPEGYEPGEDDLFGTADVIIFIPGKRMLIVMDLKYGQGLKVFADRNEQMSMYAAGAMNYFKPIIGDQVDTIKMVIHQPRLDHIDEYVVSIEELETFEDYARERILEVLHNPKFQPGESQCRWCRAKSSCSARATTSLDMVRAEPVNMLDLDVKPRDTRHLTPEQLAILWPRIKEVESWCADIKSLCLSTLQNGDELPGLKLVEGRGSRSWADEAKAKLWLSRRFKIKKEDYLETKFISVAQAEKKVGKQKFQETLADLVDTKPGSPTVALETDKRPSISTNFINLESGDSTNGY